AYLLGIDLFNHGYYWEAHEIWEGVWNANGRQGPAAPFLKALIQLAVVGVKVRQDMPESAAAHARRAAELLRQVADTTGSPRFLGLEVTALARSADQLVKQPPARPADQPVVVLFDFQLRPAIA